MKTRLISAAILIPILLIVIWVLPKAVGMIVLGLLAAIAAYELLNSTGLVRHLRLQIYTMMAAFMVCLWSYLGRDHAVGMLGLMVFVCILFAEMMNNRVKVRVEKIGICLFAGIIIPYFFSALVRILATYMGRYTIVIPFILAFIPDSGAYFAGHYFGRHKLAPVVSPNKTVEGAIGGAITAILGMLLYAVIMDFAFNRTVSYGLALLYGVAGAAADIFGDLIFSVIKRQTGMKDYGNLIPGHGGVMDRFESMITVAPVVEILLILLPVVV